jgi:hypothetical protein
MFASPQPPELRKPLAPDRDVEDDGNLSCDHYLCCLDEAIANDWMSWDCADCLLVVKLRTVESGARPT